MFGSNGCHQAARKVIAGSVFVGYSGPAVGDPAHTELALSERTLAQGVLTNGGLARLRPTGDDDVQPHPHRRGRNCAAWCLIVPSSTRSCSIAACTTNLRMFTAVNPRVIPPHPHAGGAVGQHRVDEVLGKSTRRPLLVSRGPLELPHRPQWRRGSSGETRARLTRRSRWRHPSKSRDHANPGAR